MVSPQQMAARLTRAAQAAERPGDFWRSLAPVYAGLCRQASRPFLLTQRPAEVAPERWNEAVTIFLSQLDARVVRNEILITLQGYPVAPAPNDPASAEAAFIGLADIRAWIQAGVEGEELGKNLDAEDSQIGPDALAQKLYNIVHGFRRPDGTRSTPNPEYDDLRAAIRRHMEAAQPEEGQINFSAHAPALLEIWQTTLAARYREDVKKHFTRLVKSA